MSRKNARTTAKPEPKKGLAHLAASTTYSLSGIGIASKETAIRHEMILGAIHFLAVILLDLTLPFRLLLIAVWFVVVITELLNTAIEAVVDLASPERHRLAKRAKDVASAAVFAALVLFGVGWVFALAELLSRKFACLAWLNHFGWFG